MVLYFIAQFLGSVVGAALLWGGISGASYNPTPGVVVNVTGFRPGIDVIPAVGRPPFGLGANQLNPVLSTSNGLLLEVVGTGMLIGTVLSTAVDGRSLGSLSNLAPIPIGISVWIVHLVLIPWTGELGGFFCVCVVELKTNEKSYICRLWHQPSQNIWTCDCQ